MEYYWCKGFPGRQYAPVPKLSCDLEPTITLQGLTMDMSGTYTNFLDVVVSTIDVAYARMMNVSYGKAASTAEQWSNGFRSMLL